MNQHPIAQVRLLEGISQDSLAREAGVSRHAVLRCEQGCYERIPPTILSHLTDLGYSPIELSQSYFAWVASKRKESFGRLTPTLPVFTGIAHPFIEWRIHSGLNSQVKIATLYCVNPSALSRFELKMIEERPPAQLIDALLESGYSKEIVTELSDRYFSYRRSYFNNSIKLVS